MQREVVVYFQAIPFFQEPRQLRKGGGSEMVQLLPHSCFRHLGLLQNQPRLEWRDLALLRKHCAQVAVVF